MKQFPLKMALTMGAALAFAAASGPAQAETLKFKAELTTQAQVPPFKGDGKGTAEFTYDTASRKLTWRVTYSDLSAAPTAAHIHGPATPQTTAGVAVGMPAASLSPFDGSVLLTDSQAKDLMSGAWYVNIHTPTHPGGEVRGTIVKAP